MPRRYQNLGKIVRLETMNRLLEVETSQMFKRIGLKRNRTLENAWSIKMAGSYGVVWLCQNKKKNRSVKTRFKMPIGELTLKTPKLIMPLCRNTKTDTDAKGLNN